MKTLIRIFFVTFLLLGISSCDKNENFGFTDNIETLQFVTPVSGTELVYNKQNLNNNGLFLSWAAPNSQTGATYVVEVCETGDDFENVSTLVSTQTLNHSMTVEQIVDFLLYTMELDPEVAHSLDFRVKDGTETSPVITLIFTPYRDVYDAMYVVGSINGWTPADAYPMFNAAENIFTIVLELPAGAEFKFIPQNTGWDGDWGKDPNNAGKLLQDGEQNVSGYAAGQYLVKLDFNTETYTVTPLNSLYLVGSLNGWSPGSAYAMGNASKGVFSIITDLPAGAEFKFLPTNSGWDGDWGKDPNNTGRIIQDGESNVSGYDAGKYVITVDFNTMSYKVSPVSAIPSNLFLVGSFNGWSNNASSPQFIETSTGVFQIVQTLSATDEFKFVPVAGDWGNDWGESKTSKLVLEQADENNVRSIGNGTYLITVDFNLGLISIQ